MNLQFYNPGNDFLKQFIEGYYFITDDEIGGTEKYWTFPNNYCILTTNLDSHVQLLEKSIRIVPSSYSNIYSSLVYRYINPIEIYYEKPIHEITIYFKPLGLNHFIGDSSKIFSQKTMSEFTHDLTGYEAEMTHIFKENNRQIQKDRLEEFWLSKFIQKDLNQIKSMVKDIESSLKIEEVANKHGMSRKHLNTLFIRHLGKSPGEYQKIYRFRQAISQKRPGKNLTDLAHENLFYDQSHLIKDFRALTNANPKRFFKNVDTQQKNVWLFI